VFEQGWSRTFRGAAIEDYSKFDVALFRRKRATDVLQEKVKQSSEMNYQELRRYISDCSRAGSTLSGSKCNCRRSSVPVDYAIMAILAVPSPFARRRGALTGVRVAIGVAVTTSSSRLSRRWEMLTNCRRAGGLGPDTIFAWPWILLFESSDLAALGCHTDEAVSPQSVASPQPRRTGLRVFATLRFRRRLDAASRLNFAPYVAELHLIILVERL